MKKNTFDKETLIHIGKGAAIAGGGAAMLYFLQAISQLSFGEWTAVVTAICAILINAVKEYLRGE